MKVLVQWTTAEPGNWIELDVRASGATRRAFERLPAKPEPAGGEAIDNAPGWIMSLGVQGIEFSGADHYAVEAFVEGGATALRVTTWNDDPVDWPPGTRQAKVWELRDPAPDARFGGQVNTRQRLTVYDEASPSRWEGVEASDGPVVVRPWSEFVPPRAAVTRHGIWVSDALMHQHTSARSHRSWREWIV